MKRGRTLLVVALIVSLIATGVIQSVAVGQRHRLLRTNTSGSGQSLASMNSFALALLLGGLRGPLVMFLWTQSEAQKSEKNLEGVETQIEWIRLLQPEFDSVHLFQIWNKAYNLSVQMASLSNKYSVILDALDYAKSVDRERPDDINIVMAIASVFNDKLSGSQEKKDYRRFVRRDTKYRVQKKVDRVAGVRPTQYDSILDPNGEIRPELLTPHLPRPTSNSTTSSTGISNFYDGSELQFLKRYEPYTYGVSPTGLAYNYYKRTQLLQRSSKQRHLQMSDLVIDSRPGLTLKSWAEEEHEVGTRAEAAYWGGKVPDERFDVLAAITDNGPTAPTPSSKETDAARNAAYDEAVFQYGLASRLIRDAETEMREHLANPDYYVAHVDTYRSQLEHIVATQSLTQADLLYLKAIRAQGAQRGDLLSQAAELYHKAARQFSIVRLRYFVEDGLLTGVFPSGFTKQNADKLSDEQLTAILATLDTRLKRLPYDPNSDDTREYNTDIQHALKRMELCQKSR